MECYGIPEDPSLRTSSRLRKWWLHSVCGYKVLEVRRYPRSGWFGRLTYEENYRLLPKDETKH